MHWRRKWQPTPVGSCLENPRDGRAWWAAIYGVAQSRTRLKWLSSSSSSSNRSFAELRVCALSTVPSWSSVYLAKPDSKITLSERCLWFLSPGAGDLYLLYTSLTLFLCPANSLSALCLTLQYFMHVLVPAIRYQFLGRQLRDQPLLGDVSTFPQILYFLYKT